MIMRLIIVLHETVKRMTGSRRRSLEWSQPGSTSWRGSVPNAVKRTIIDQLGCLRKLSSQYSKQLEWKSLE